MKRKLNISIGAILVFLSIGRLFSAELPVIEMPEYVITGVERATSLSGTKIPPQSLSLFQVPDNENSERPTIPVDITATPITRPTLVGNVGGGYTEIEAMAGLFGLASGRFETASEGRLTGYMVRTKLGRAPTRVSTGPRMNWQAEGGGIRWFGDEVTLAPRLGFAYSTFAVRNANVDITHTQFDLNVDAAMTPVTLFDGRLAGKFLFNLTNLDNDRNINASVDRILLNYSRSAGVGWIDSRFEIALEAVSVDERSHTLYSLESVYYQPYSESILIRAGLFGYRGSVIQTPVLVAPGQSEVREGAAILAGATWSIGKGKSLDLEIRPVPRFETFTKTFAQSMILDSTARASTVEKPIALKLRYSHQLTLVSKFDVELSHSQERHRPFQHSDNVGNWSLITRNAKLSAARVSVETEPVRSTSLKLFGEFTDASSGGTLPGNEAPFIAPAKVGADVLSYFGSYSLGNSIIWSAGAPFDFNTSETSPDAVEWNVSLQWLVRPGLTGKFGVDNLLDNYRWTVPGYPEPPLTFWAGIEWRDGAGVW